MSSEGKRPSTGRAFKTKYSLRIAYFGDRCGFSNRVISWKGGSCSGWGKGRRKV